MQVLSCSEATVPADSDLEWQQLPFWLMLHTVDSMAASPADLKLVLQLLPWGAELRGAKVNNFDAGILLWAGKQHVFGLQVPAG